MGSLFHPEPDQGGRFRGCDFLFIYVTSRWESVWRNLDWNLTRVRVRIQFTDFLEAQLCVKPRPLTRPGVRGRQLRFRSTRGGHVVVVTKASSQIPLTLAPSPNLSPASSSNVSLLTLSPALFSTPGTLADTGRISVPPQAPFAAGMLQRKPLATLDPQSAHSRLTEDMSNSPSSSRLPPDSKDTAANCYARQIVSRRSIGDEGALIQSVSSSRKNSLSQ